MQSDHTLGSHIGVTQERLDEMRDEFIDWFVVELKSHNTDLCHCNVIDKCTKIGRTPQEVATLAFQIGEALPRLMYEINQIGDSKKVIN